mgnify:CR=1 FL=1
MFSLINESDKYLVKLEPTTCLPCFLVGGRRPAGSRIARHRVEKVRVFIQEVLERKEVLLDG